MLGQFLNATFVVGGCALVNVCDCQGRKPAFLSCGTVRATFVSAVPGGTS
jgi:hypothetical protein